jgi:hypothetical protein
MTFWWSGCDTGGATCPADGRFAFGVEIPLPAPVVTTDYAYALVDVSGHPDINGNYTEAQYALYGRIDPSQQPVAMISGQTIVASW